MREKCKRCLLLQAGEKQSYDEIKKYIGTLDSSVKVSENEYKNRLDLCRKCDQLLSGMCLKCGCYVEVRAVFKNKSCADADNVRWSKISD